jgi:hypothetical protein
MCAGEQTMFGVADILVAYPLGGGSSSYPIWRIRVGAREAVEVNKGASHQSWHHSPDCRDPANGPQFGNSVQKEIVSAPLSKAN